MLRRFRAQARVSQEELAERSGVSARAIGDIETGVSLWPRAITISLISEALGLDAAARQSLRNASTRRGLGVRSTLPSASELIGRERDIADVIAILRDDSVRLVTLSGGAGVGKTALAVCVAAQVAHDFGERVHYIDLGALADPVLVPTKVSLAVGVREVRGESLAATIATTIAGQPMLVILDNFERVAAAAPFVAELLAATTQLKILIVSRSRLRLRAERVVTLAPLEPAAATALLMQRVRSHLPEFDPSQDGTRAVEELSQALGGLPLAIELVAPLLRTTSPAELRTHLSHPLDLLSTNDPRAPARHRTMRDAITWSYALLPAAAQQLFRRVAVFDGLFTEDGAQQLAAGDGIPADPLLTLRALETLLNHNLVNACDREADESEFELHPLVGEYAKELLADEAEREGAYARLTEYCAALVQAPPQPEPTHDAAARARVNRESSHFDAALGWLKATGRIDRALSLAVSIWPIWYRRGESAHGYAWISSLLAASHPSTCDPALLGDAHMAAAGLAQVSGFLERAEEHGAAALIVKRASGDLAATAAVLAGIAICAQFKGDPERARSIFQESLAIRREVGDGLNIARSLLDFGAFESDEGRLHEAARYLDEALIRFRQAGRKMGHSLTLGSLALIAARAGSPANAQLLAQEAVELAESVGFVESACVAKSILSRALLACDDLDRAERLARSVLETPEVSPTASAEAARVLAAIAFRRGLPREAARLLGAAASCSAVLPPADRDAQERFLELVSSELGGEFAVEFERGRANSVSNFMV